MKKRNQFRNKPVAFQMPGRAAFGRAYLSGYYPSTCDDLPQHTCDPCETREFGRIRSAGFIKSTSVLAPPNGGDATNAAVWQQEMQAGNAIVIPFTNGEMPAPTEKTIDGYGDVVDELINYTFSATYNDPNFAGNCDFYNAMVGKRNFYFFFRTSSQTYITPVSVTIVPKFSVANDLNSTVVWNVMVKWISGSFPCPFNTPETIFDECFELGE